MRNFFRPASLKTRIVLLVVALLIAGIWGLAARVTTVMQRDLEKLLADQLSATVAYTAIDMDRDVEERFDALKRFAASITPDLLADPVELQRYLEQREIIRAAFDMNLTFANREGIIVADHPLAVERLGRSVKDRPYFEDPMASGKTVIGSPIMGRLSQKPFVPMSAPVRDAAGAIAGVLIDRVGLVNAHPFGQLDEINVGQTGYFLVVSPRDRVIVSATEHARVMTQMPARGSSPVLDRRLDEGYKGPLRDIDTHGVEVLTVGHKLTTTGWMVIAAVPAREIFAPIAMLKRQIYLAAVVISLLIAVILRLVLARQFARLKEAGEAMRRMSDGEQPLAAIPVTREDEIGKLNENFNRLVAERNRLDAELRGEISERRQAEEALEKAMTRLQALSKRITTAREEERREIALELHEQSGQELTTLKIHLEMLQRHVGGEDAQARVRDALVVVRLMLRRIREMALDLRPPQLDDFGLYAALRAHCKQQADAAGWVMHFHVPDADTRPAHIIELACYRVVEEALANVSRHGNATEVWVNLRRSGDGLHLCVRDNGAGFNAARMRDDAEHEHVGLIEMEERARQVGGRLEIESKPGNGTEIRAVFPLCSPDETGRLRAA